MRRIISIILLAAIALMPSAALGYSDAYARLMGKDVTVTKIKLNASKATIINHYGVTDTYRLIATTSPSNAPDQSLSWTSSDESVVTVSPDGLVTAAGEGKATVTASANDRDGVVKSSCDFTVKTTRVTNFQLESSQVFLDHTDSDDSVTINYSVYPSSATFQDPVWSSSDPSVASVDEKTGLITARSAGRATVTAKVDLGRKKASCEVVVRDKSALKRVTVCAVGDLVLGGDANHNDGLNRFDDLLTNNGKQPPDYSYNLKNVKSLFDSCDLTVANLEAALTTKSHPVRAKSSYNFRGKPPYAQILAEGGVDVVSIVNNHTNDFGTAGLQDTKAALERMGVKYASAASPAFIEKNGVKIAVVGIMTQSGNYTYVIKRKLREAAGADLKIVLMHCAELTMYDNSIRQSQITNAKTAIDAGADMVVCAHPAVISGIGEYKGKYIYFDIGTFVGSGLKTCISNYAVTQTFLVGHDNTGSYVECDTPTVYPGFSSGYSKVIGDINNNCQPVLFGLQSTSYAKAMSDRIASTIRTLSRKLDGAVTPGEFNVG